MAMKIHRTADNLEMFECRSKLFFKDFMEARLPISFFIHLDHFRDADTVQSFSLDNAKTNEKLVIKRVTRRSDSMTISRFPMDAAEEWIEEMAKYEDEDQYRNIRIYLQ
jgi:hypothetical protein